MGVNSLPKTVTRHRRGCDLNPGPSAPESSTLTARLHSTVLTKARKISLQATALPVQTRPCIGCLVKSARLVNFFRKSATVRYGGLFAATKFSIASLTYLRKNQSTSLQSLACPISSISTTRTYTHTYITYLRKYIRVYVIEQVHDYNYSSVIFAQK